MKATNTLPLFLGFSSQKGGVGKSTLAEITASMLYYEKGVELFVVDCDLSQDSFYKLRQREKAAIEESPSLSEQMKSYFDHLGRKAYRVLKADPKEAIAKTNAYLSSHPNEDFKLVIFDFPGHAGTRELLELSLEMDCILSPIEADVQSIVSCLAYAKSISDLGVSIETARVKDIMLLWNKVDRRVKNTLMEHYSAYIKEEGLTLFPGCVYATHRFSHDLEQYGFRGAFRSPSLPPGLDELVEALMERLDIEIQKHDGND